MESETTVNPEQWWKWTVSMGLGALLVSFGFWAGGKFASPTSTSNAAIAFPNSSAPNNAALPNQVGASSLPPELFRATATHGTSNMAIATGVVSDEAEGIFFLDFLTGDLQCWVYYPRSGVFGAKFATNVRNQLPSGKNPEYLMVTGGIEPGPTSSNTRPAGIIVYVMDVNEGVFAAYSVPWTRAAENAQQPQTGQLVPIAGGQIRPPLPAKK